MRFDIQKEALTKALDVTGLAVTNDSGVITSSVLFDIDAGELVLWSTDRRLFTRVPTSIVEGTDQGAGKFTVEFARLSQWVRNVMGDVIHIEQNTEGINMTCGGFEAHFRTLDAASFPSLQKRFDEKELLFRSNPDTFTEALKFVRPFIGDETSNNPVANQLQVAELRGGEFMATDSTMISLFKFGGGSEVVDGLDSETSYKVGKNEVKKVATFLTKTCASEFRVYKSDSVYMIESDDGSFFCYNEPLYTLPDIQGIPRDLDEEEVWTVRKDDLKKAVNCLTATADPEDKALSVSASGAEGEEGRLMLKMRDASEKRSSEAPIPFQRVRAGKEAPSFMVNYDYLTEPLSLYSGDEVTIGVNASKNSGSKYLKLYEKSESDDVRVCLITLRMDA